MSFFFKGYVNLLQRYTLPTQMATGGVMSGLGSCIAQHAVEGKEWNQHEAYRTRRLMVYGGIIFAPIANRWHAALNLIQLRGRWTTVTTRVLTDAVFFSPFATCLFYASQGTMEGRPWKSTPKMQGIQERLGDRLWPTVVKQWMLFAPANFISLSVLPVYARPPFLNIFALAWQTYLAGAQHVGAIVPDEAESVAVMAVEVME